MLDAIQETDYSFVENDSKETFKSLANQPTRSDALPSERDCLPFPEMDFNFDDLEAILED
jgi:hypothetical protein